jgi:2-polyprenyl-3-methyl-5-hydroxy-6-metoxy-1,4-benzoquinol methylase
MESEKILERIKNVYQKSVQLYYPEKEGNVDTFESKYIDRSKSLNINNQASHDSYKIEIDGNYLLFFNTIYTSTIRRWLKNILKRIAWPVLKRQVYFNSAVRQTLYDLIQKNYEYSARDIEINNKLSQLEQKVEQISTEIHITKGGNSQFASAEEAKKSSGLWFNDPIWVGHRDDGEAYWVQTTERILEKTFVIHSLANLYASKQIQILDVGAAESLLSYELASFNYSVTAIDIRPIALFHPNLKFVKTNICKPVLPPASFDCVIALSTLEHIGLGWYGDKTGENYDIEAVKQIYVLLKPEGYFILTVPYGKKAVTPVHRIYDQESLQTLTQNFKVTQISYGVRKDDFTWTITEDELEASGQEHNPNNYLPGAVAMLVCKKLVV